MYETWGNDCRDCLLLELFRHTGDSANHAHATNGDSDIDARAGALGTNHAVY